MTKSPPSPTPSGAGSSCFDSDVIAEARTTSITAALGRARTLGIERLDAQLLLLHALGRPDTDRAWLLAHDGDAVAPDIAHAFGGLCARRATGEPLAYIVGHQEFFGLTLHVDRRVLIPRPDTETLVGWALERLHAWLARHPTPDATDGPHILDLGCGSGAIALAIAAQLAGAGPHTRVVATDASRAALDLARENFARLRRRDRPAVDFLEGDWFDPVTGQFDLIVSNPPYIASTDPHLAALTYEPLAALTAGSDGLDDLRKIIATAPRYLRQGGWLLLEHGYDQAGAVQDLLHRRGFADVQAKSDLSGVLRCAGAIWPL